jgi:hypothetical protein
LEAKEHVFGVVVVVVLLFCCSAALFFCSSVVLLLLLLLTQWKHTPGSRFETFFPARCIINLFGSAWWEFVVAGLCCDAI